MVRFVSIAFLSLALLTPGFLPARSLTFTCRMTGETHGSCCCGPRAGKSHRPESPECRCCDVRIVDSPKLSAALPQGAAQPPISSHPAVAVLPVSLRSNYDFINSPLLLRSHPPWRGRARPAFLLYSNFLC